MSALTEDRGTLKKFSRLRTLEAAGTIYAGAIAAVNGDGKAVAASDASGLKVIGCAQNAAVIGENVSIEEGCFAFDGTGITNADIGKTVYVADDQTVSLSAGTNGVIAGTVYDVDAEGVWVAIGRTAQGVYQPAMTFASSAEVNAGAVANKPIAPDQLKAAGIVKPTAAATVADLALTSVTGAAGSEVYAAGESSANLIADLLAIRTKLNALIATGKTNGLIAAE